jgi:hypothetical protein
MEGGPHLPFNLPDLGDPLLFPQSDVNKLDLAGEPSSAEVVSETCTNSRIQTVEMDPKPHIKGRNRRKLDLKNECATTVRQFSFNSSSLAHTDCSSSR